MPMAACDQVGHLSNAPAKAALVPKYVPGKKMTAKEHLQPARYWIKKTMS